MSNVVKISKARLIGQHDAQMVERLSETIVDLWVELHRYARSDAPVEVSNRLLEILGGGVFSWCWAVLSIYQKPFQKRDAESIARLYAHLCEASVRPELCNQVCYSVSMISARMRTISALARKEKGQEAKQLWKAYNYLFGVLYELLDTGALANMPNSSGSARMHEQVVENLVVVLPERWAMLKKHACASGQVGRISSLLGETLRLPVFDGILAQEEGRVEPGSEALRQWFFNFNVRKQRGYYAELGSSVHALSRIAKELRDYRAASPRNSRRWCFANAAISAVEKTMIEVLGSGALYSIP